MASPSGVVSLRFPQLGVVRKVGFDNESNQSEFSTPYSVNVRLEDSLENRLRGGSFVPKARPTVPAKIVYRDRQIIIDGKVANVSRVGQHNNFTYSSDISDSLRPTILQFTEAGDLSENLVGLIPHKDQYLIAFTANQTWVLQGDPVAGNIRRVTDRVGIVGSHAWCVANDAVYFLSKRGLYVMGADGSELRPLSEEIIPNNLLNLAVNNEILLDYDHPTRGVFMHMPVTIKISETDWFYDTARGGFWPCVSGTNQSHVLIGPIRVGQSDMYGRILDIHGNIADGSANVTWSIITGITAEDAAKNGRLAINAALNNSNFGSYVSATGTWSAGRSHRAYPRTRALWFCLWLRSSGVWAYEMVKTTRIISGKWR